MNYHIATTIAVVMVWANCCQPNTHAAQPDNDQVLLTLDPDFDVTTLEPKDAKLALERLRDQYALRIVTGHQATWPGITIAAPDGGWDLSAFGELSVDVVNLADAPVTINCRVDGAEGDGSHDSLTESLSLAALEQCTLNVQLTRKLPPQLTEQLFGMRGFPGGAKENGIDPRHISRLIIFLNEPRREHAFLLRDIRARGRHQADQWTAWSPSEFFPMIDDLGQFIHAQWPGKSASVAQLRQDAVDEATDLAAHSGPKDWTQYGGWQKGPLMEATGFFYPTKYDNQWWLVDPTGHLFWSHGVDCVSFSSGTTPITDRKFYFASLPSEESPLARFYGRGRWAPHGYYHDKESYRTFNFTGANLWRKYGENWYETAADRVHQRLRSWSLNTIANWSDGEIYLRRRTPYVVAIDSGRAQRIEGSEGYWGKFPDPFDPSFRSSLGRRLQSEQHRSIGDPWCIGYFVDNELAWGDEWSLARAALASPAQQPAKQAFIKDLRQKYSTIELLNAAWNSSFASWQALGDSRTPPAVAEAKEDLGAFYSHLAEEYFHEARAAIKDVAPHQLYLGCRFAWVNQRGAQAAAKYCDVMSYNLYRYDVADFSLPERLDVPVVIGEFHFGALDRGMFHTGLRPTSSQKERAEAYRKYVTGALNNPLIVGTHWFQYGDQATTGRGDGENYQIGLVDICDSPYPETVEAVRQIGLDMYPTRMQASPPAGTQSSPR